MRYAIRLICFILLIFLLSLSNFAQTSLDSTPRLPNPKPEQRMPIECEWSPDSIHAGLGIEYLKKNLSLCRAVGNSPAIADMLRALGLQYMTQRKQTEASTAFQESLSVSIAAGYKEGMISSLLFVGQIHNNQGNTASASESLHKALALSEELRDKRLMAQSLQSLGGFYQLHNNSDQSLAFYERELKLREELGDKLQLSGALIRIGQSYRRQGGDYSKALEYLLKGLKLEEETGNKRVLGSSLGTIANIYREQSYYSQALEFYGRSLKLSEEINDKSGIFSALNSIAQTYQTQGNQSKALEYYQRLLKMLEAFQQELQTGKQETTLPSLGSALNSSFYRDINLLPIQNASTLNNIGINYMEANNYDLATENLQKSLQIVQMISPPIVTNTSNIFERGSSIAHSSRVIFTLRLLGLLNLRFGKYQLAIDYYQKTLPFCEQNVFNDPGIAQQCLAALSNISYMYGLQRNYAKGLEYAERASNLSGKFGNSYNSFEPQWLLGDAYRVNNQLEKARQALEKAISIFESSRAKIVEEEHRLNFIERTEKRPFELYIDVLMQLHKLRPFEGFDALALQASERFRARLLVELLNESKAQIRQRVEQKLLAQERSLQQRLNARAEQQTRLLSVKHSAEQAAALQKEIESLTAEFNQTKAQIRIHSPRYAALTQPQPLNVSEIQRDLLNADTVLLEYALGVERSYLWVVSSNSISSYELPKRTEIETDVRRIVGLLNNGERWASDEKIKAEYFEAANPLSQKLLPSSLLSQLKGKRLVIVSDGALQYLPFGALPLPLLSKAGNKTAETDSVPLAVENEIVSLPSASVLAVLRRETANRKQAAKSIAIFADPVFSENDERLSTVKANQSKANQSITNDLNRLLLERAFNWDGKSNEAFSIPRLPFTRREAEGIFATVSQANSLKALDFEASRDGLLKSDLSNYRIIHFATHGLLNSENPELSGIVLSLVNEQGQPTDGFLRLNEIYNLNLSADLVVLSACQTALGKEIKGEGLLGLTRGFMYAGSPRVVASLWKVDDVATAELMKLFYKKMLQEKMRPAAALRAAKVEMWKQKRWNAPFYWAAFEIQGEWR